MRTRSVLVTSWTDTTLNMLSTYYVACLKTMMWIRVLFGHYYYSGSSKVFKILIWLYCLVFMSFLAFMFLRQQNHSIEYLVRNNYIEIMIDCAASLIFQGKYMENTLSLITVTGNMLDMESVPVSYKMLGVVPIILSLRVYNCKRLLSSEDTTYLTICFILSSCTTLCYFSKLLVFDIFYHRMRQLRKSFEYRFVTVNAIGKERVRHRIMNIRKCLCVYNCLLQYVENMNIQLEFSLFSAVVLYFPKAVVYMRYTILLILRKELFTINALSTFITFLYTICAATSPTIVFELAKNEVDIIKDNLFKQSVMNTDEELRSETQRALQHISRRPLQYQLCRMMPMDISLLLGFISLCMTHVIVFVQLT